MFTMSARIGAAAIASLAILSGCQTGSLTGSGPISLSPGVKAYYAEFSERWNPGWFAVSEDGDWAAYTYCDESTCSGMGDQQTAVNLCEDEGKRKCYIYANRSGVVWRDAPLSVEKAPPLPQ